MSIQTQFPQIFTTKEALKKGLNRRQLQHLLSSGQIERLERGLYQKKGVKRIKVEEDLGSEEDQFKRATKLIEAPCAVCLLSALSYYNLTDEIPSDVWLLVPYEKRSQKTGIKLLRSRRPQWDIGIISSKEKFAITTIERTLIDCLIHAKKIGKHNAISSIKTALKEKKTTLSKLIDMSIQLKVKHRVISTLEVFA